MLLSFLQKQSPGRRVICHIGILGLRSCLFSPLQFISTYNRAVQSSSCNSSISRNTVDLIGTIKSLQHIIDGTLMKSTMFLMKIRVFKLEWIQISLFTCMGWEAC